MRYLQARLVALSVILASVGATASAQTLPELLQPVDKQVESQLMSEKNHAFRIQVYPAKQFKIVNVNFSLLESDVPEFTITLPGQVKLTVTRRPGGVAQQSEQTRIWSGIVTKAEYKGSAVGNRAELPPAVVDLWVRTGPQEVPISLLKKIADERGVEAETIPQVASEARATQITTRLDLKTLSGSWVVPALGRTFVIQPIDDDPRYHVFLEQDPERMATGAHDSADSERKLKASQEFRLRLEKERQEEEQGPAPRRAGPGSGRRHGRAEHR